MDLTVNTRLTNGLQIQGGVSTGRQALEYCDVAAAVPESLTVMNVRQPEPFCDQQTPFLTQVKGLATYLIPRIDVQVAGTLQSRPFVGTNVPSIASQSLAANWLVSNAQVVPELGRPMSGNAQTTFVNLVEPGASLRRADHAGRFPCGEGPALRSHADQRRARSVQHLQREPGGDLQPELRPTRRGWAPAGCSQAPSSGRASRS